jgi:hypothetical protein
MLDERGRFDIGKIAPVAFAVGEHLGDMGFSRRS